MVSALYGNNHVKHIILTSRPRAWYHFLHHVVSSLSIGDNVLNQLFFFTWNENERAFLETSDELSIYFASIRALMRGQEFSCKDNTNLQDANVLLFIDDVPSLEKLVFKRRHWEQQLQLAYYRLELMRYQALQFLKSIVNLTRTAVILVTRQLPQLERAIRKFIQRDHLLSAEHEEIRRITIPKWVLELNKWFIVFEEGSSLLDVREVAVTMISPQEWLTFLPRVPPVRHFGIIPDNPLASTKRTCDSIMKYWLTAVTKKV